MHLVLRAHTLAGAALTQALSGRFDERGGTLGRSDDNTLALPDPERHISRLQAQVSHSARGYSIRNLGSASTIVLNDRPVEPGESAPIGDGDELQIGAYLLRASVAYDDEASPMVASRAQARPADPPPSIHAPAVRLPEGFSFGEAAAPRHPRAADGDGDADTGAATGDPFDPLRPAGASQAGCVDHLIGGSGNGHAALQRFMHPDRGSTTGTPAAGAPCTVDPLKLVSPATAPRSPSPSPVAVLKDRTPEIHAAMPLPRAMAEVRLEPTAAAVDVDLDATVPPLAAPLAPGARADALWAAFCEGTGVPLAPPQGLNPELMRVIGQLLRHLAAGTVQLVRLRAETKNELRFPVTMLHTRDNNPLRYSPNVQAALTQLLQPPLSGFLPGPEAAQEAMDDLFAHAIGTMTGMRAAIEGVLARFEPHRLEAQLGAGHVLDAVMPMHRRARLWDLYLQHFEGVGAEAKEDFDRLFGQAFVGAYEQQLDQLDAERRAQRRKAR